MASTSEMNASSDSDTVTESDDGPTSLTVIDETDSPIWEKTSKTPGKGPLHGVVPLNSPYGGASPDVLLASEMGAIRRPNYPVSSRYVAR